MSKTHIKLFIPGPVEVYPETFVSLSQPLIGHRSGDFKTLYARLQPKLQKLFYTTAPVYLMTCSAWGAMEAAVRNCVARKLLCLCNGAFSDKWAEVARDCGKEVETLSWEWGRPIEPERVEKKLREGGFDAVTLVSNETCVGLFNPLQEIMAVLQKFPEVVSIVDTVSIFGARPIPQDAWGIDVMITGTQKALALPPGMALVGVSAKALARSRKVSGKGFYFDFVAYHEFHQQAQTPSTPNLPLVFGLDYRCGQIEREGLEARYARHSAMNRHVVEWCEANGFPLFPPREHASVSLVCARNERGIDLEALNKRLKAEYAMMINTGYGALKGKTFRISTMGDETVESLAALTANLEKLLGELA